LTADQEAAIEALLMSTVNKISHPILNQMRRFFETSETDDPKDPFGLDESATMSRTLVIGSRGSKLALWQAEHARERLLLLNPQIDIRIEIIKTTGDVKKDPLSVIGGKGVFTKELEDALLDGRIDIAVHSLKDLPTILPEGLSISAIGKREDARDALVLGAGSEFDPTALGNLPRGAIVGTSSPRRLAQLRCWFGDNLIIKDLRGNVDTRIRKLDEGQYDAVILASAG